MLHQTVIGTHQKIAVGCSAPLAEMSHRIGFRINDVHHRASPALILQVSHRGLKLIQRGQCRTHFPAPRAMDAIGSLQEQPVPLSATHNVNGTDITLAVREYGAPADSDGHFVATDVQNGVDDVARFLGMAASGVTPQVGK